MGGRGITAADALPALRQTAYPLSPTLSPWERERASLDGPDQSGTLLPPRDVRLSIPQASLLSARIFPVIDFTSARELVNWAREDANDLDLAEQIFFGGHPYTRLREFDAKAGHDVLKLRVPAVPSHMRKLATHAVWSLKHALDHATCSAILAVTGQTPEEVTFPFVSHRNALEGRLTAVSKRHPKGKYPLELLPLFRRFEPYPTSDGLIDGSDELCAISRMANASKHSVGLSHNLRFRLTHFAPPPLLSAYSREIGTAKDRS